MSAPALELCGVSSGYGASTVVRGVSLSVMPGEIVVLLGRNGMGKTTLLRTVMGYNRLQAGSLCILGADLSHASVHRRARAGVAYVPQEHALFQDLSVRDNLRLGLRSDRAFAGALERVRDLFPFLADRLAQMAGTLSGGEQKMLLVARALMTQARLVLIDEATEGLQPSVVERLAAVIRHAARAEGRAVLLVEQHVGFSVSVADRCAALKLGEIAFEGAAAEPSIRQVLEGHLKI